MTPDAVAVFFASLLLLGAVAMLLALAFTGSRQALRSGAGSIAATIAVAATAGSLYFSEIAGFVPCELCWYQRIAMYPLAIIAPAAVLKQDRSALIYTQILATLGLLVAAYHVQLQAFPDQQTFCDLANPCTESPIEVFGFLTIPQMSALSFAGIAILATLARTAGPTSGESA